MFASPYVLMHGALIGFIFGVLLQKGGVAQFDTIVGQLLLKDFRMLKIMLTAIIVGGIGVYSFVAFGWASGLIVGPFSLIGVALGAAILALGMAVLGYCPGTAVAAAGQGARDALFGLLGLIIGAGIYAHLYPWFVQKVLSKSMYPAQTTLATISGISPGLILVGLMIVSVALFWFLEHWESGR